MRFDFIQEVCGQTVVRPKESREHIRSQKIDRILTGKYTAIPCFRSIMALVFFADLQRNGSWPVRSARYGITWLGRVDAHMTAGHVNDVIQSLVMDGILTVWEAFSAFCRSL